MLEMLGVQEGIRFFVFIILSFAFFVGIMLIVSHEAFVQFNAALQKEYGLKKKLFPKIEESKSNVIDAAVLKYRKLAGLLISICSYLLLLTYKL